MKLEDIKIGMKVEPHSKSAQNPLEESSHWNKALENDQEFLYVNSITEDGIVLAYQDQIKQTGDFFEPSDFEPYQEPKIMITQQEFDNLKEGDVLISQKCKGEDERIIFQGKFGQIGLFLTAKSNRSWVNSFAELQKNEFSLVKKEPNYQGFPIGDYSDKTVIVKVWDKDPNNKQIGVISKVTEQGIYIEKLSVNWFNAEIITPTPITLIQ